MVIISDSTPHVFAWFLSDCGPIAWTRRHVTISKPLSRCAGDTAVIDEGRSAGLHRRYRTPSGVCPQGCVHNSHSAASACPWNLWPENDSKSILVTSGSVTRVMHANSIPPARRYTVGYSIRVHLQQDLWNIRTLSHLCVPRLAPLGVKSLRQSNHHGCHDGLP
jgi:hypothetical protein